MHYFRFLYVVPVASLLSACALFQPVREKTAINFADDCIVHESQIVAPSAIHLEAAIAVALHKCDVEIHAAQVTLLQEMRGDGRSDALKLGELRENEHRLARQTISLQRAI